MANTNYSTRDFLKEILATEGVSDKAKDFAKTELIKMDERNEKRKATKSKDQIANEEIEKDILEALKDGAMFSTALATAIGQNTQKTNGVAGEMVKRGELVKTKEKVKGKGEQTKYALPETPSEE
jgi:predicted transcriptional regulator